MGLAGSGFRALEKLKASTLLRMIGKSHSVPPAASPEGPHIQP